MIVEEEFIIHLLQRLIQNYVDTETDKGNV